MEEEELTKETYRELAEPHMTLDVVAEATEIAKVLFEDGEFYRMAKNPEETFVYGLVFGRALAKGGLWDSMVHKAKVVRERNEAKEGWRT